MSSIMKGLQVDENLRDWFKEKWVRFGPDGKIRGDCARGDDSEGKPKCLPQSKAQSLGKKGRASAASRKRREDPNPERSGKAINVNTKKKSNEGVVDEMAAAGNFGNRIWYHGTTRRAFNKILQTGVVKPAVADQSEPGAAIWLTSDLEQALDYGNVVLAIPNNIARNYNIERWSGFPHGTMKRQNLKAEAYNMVIKDAVPLKYWKLVDPKTGNLVNIPKPSVTETTSGVTHAGYKWSLEQGGEVPWKSNVEVNTFIRVQDSKGKTILGVWADVHGDDVEIQYSEVFDKKLRGKGIYTDLLTTLAKQYNIISDQDQNNAAREIYKKLGADYNYKSERHTLRREKQSAAEDSLNEIARLDKTNFDPKESEFSLIRLRSKWFKDRMKPLPGGSRYTYVIEKSSKGIDITILDSKNLNYTVGALDLERLTTLPGNCAKVSVISVHPKYRSEGIAKALYGLALLPPPIGLGITLLSDDKQTSGGIRNWISLNKIPGVEVTGIVRIKKENLATSTRSEKFQDGIEQEYDEILNDLFGKVGGVLYGETGNYYWYQIPVKLAGARLENMIKNSLIKIYPDRSAAPAVLSTLLMAKYDDSNQGVAEGSEQISIKARKGHNKFATELSVDGKTAGVYQYDANSGRSIAEVYPEYRGKGFGKILVLHAIYTAVKLGMDFVEDESRTAEYDNVLDSLDSNGLAVNDDGYWYVTGEGEQYLKQRLKQGVAETQLDELKCWSGYTRVQGVPAGKPGSCKKKTNEEQHSENCPQCGGEMVSEELMNEKKDACYYKVKSRYKVWPSAYASGALVKCRKKGASNWGTSSSSSKKPKRESAILKGLQ